MSMISNLFAGVAGYVGRPDAVGAVGVFRRPTGAEQWEHVLSTHECYTVFVHPTDPATVFAGTSDGVWRSSDHGATFARAAFPEAGRQIWSFLVAEEDPDLVFAGASPIGIFRSSDRGATWQAMPDPGIVEHCKGPFAARVMRMAQRPGRPGEIYAALEISGAMHTADGAQTWTDLSADLIRLSDLPHLRSKIVSDTFAEGMLDGHAVTISAAAPDRPIIACRMGLFTSDDGGRHWRDMEVGRFSPTTYGRDVKAAPQDPSTLYAALSVSAASHDGGLYRSRDGGASWERFDKVQVHGTIMSIGLHPRDPDQVYLAARYQGEIFGTTDGGTTWSAMPLPGLVKDIYCVACG